MKWKTLLICFCAALAVQCAEAIPEHSPENSSECLKGDFPEDSFEALSVRIPELLPIAELIDSLDKAICESGRYVSVREFRIARLKQQLSQADTASTDFFRWNREIYKEYKAYICDSAIHYLNRNLHWAEQHGQQDAAYETRLELAYLMASTGMYQEAFEHLGQVNRSTLSPRLLPDYYRGYSRLYSESGAYTQDADFRKRYRQLAACYRDSLVQIIPPDTSLYCEMVEQRELEAGHLAFSLRINDKRLATVQPDTPEYALITYQRSRILRNLADSGDEEMRWLAASALTDIRLAITDHASLWNLAQQLYEKGDIERAYRYIRFSWDETRRYNARSRSLQTAGILSLIDLTYQAMQKKQSERLRLYLIFISALALLLILALTYIYNQMKRLALARNRLEDTNGRLEQANSRLEQANGQLELSNRIKEEYIGRFMRLCSQNIDRWESYRRIVHNMVVAGQTDELLKMVRSRKLLDSEWKELYKNFDSAFLHLFPDFVEKFNDLLLPEEQIVLRKGELLNTELRIFALIRLGIDDSSKIAEFLRYSVNTIYNYRAQVKNKARISREDFETRLMMIR